MDFTEENQIAPHLVLEHWYYQAKFNLLRRTVASAKVLRPETQLADVGCGLGVFLTLLEKEGSLSPQQMVGIDPAAKPNQTSLGGTVPILTAWPEQGFDLIVLMDVLEHIENDQAMLAQAWAQLRPGGFAFITVPAFAFLWSRHDVVLGHYRRYTRGSLGQLLATIPGLQVKRLHYFYAAILPVAMIVRALRRKAEDSASDMKAVPGWLNQLLKAILYIESFFAPFNKLGGLTVVALVQKNQ